MPDAPSLEFHVFLPQMRLTMPQLVEKAQVAEAAGFAGLAGMDHLAPPLAEHQPMFEAMVTNTWLAAHTERLTLSSLVLCDAFRHPATLAREAVTLDHASGGRFELGLGWGSVVSEFEMFGVEPTDAPARVGRMRETLEIVEALWSGEAVDHDGEHFTLRGARQMPRPLGRIPIVIGGTGRRTLELVARHADWWNLHTGVLDDMDRLDDLRARAGRARASLQLNVAYVHDDADRDEVAALAHRRFGPHAVVGRGPELVDHLGRLAEHGFERIYTWFCDFAPPETLHAFGEHVIPTFAR
ncbi:MAG TPA: LLM class flavin-dependent oxidoreductase [Acidimicrobiales bacterium]|nr:LLM class flavin-dependent oxidoreductase [Acidimicrobiales bacterium]